MNNKLKVGLDFGLSNLKAVLVEQSEVIKSWLLPNPGPASSGVLQRVLVDLDLANIALIATTGGRHRQLPNSFEGVPIFPVEESEAIGRGGLAVAGLSKGLIISAGSGTAMIAADDGYRHISGTAVGGGTLLGLSRLLLGTIDPKEIEQLSLQGDAQAVDWTLADVLQRGIGSLPINATAVNLGRLIEVEAKADDLAAGLLNLIGQVIAMIALNTAKAFAYKDVVFVGHLTAFSLLKSVISDVFALYEMKKPIFPNLAIYATAFGAVLESQ